MTTFPVGGEKGCFHFKTAQLSKRAALTWRYCAISLGQRARSFREVCVITHACFAAGDLNTSPVSPLSLGQRAQSFTEVRVIIHACFAVGDLNTSPGSPLYQFLQDGMLRVTRFAPEDMTGTHSVEQNPVT